MSNHCRFLFRLSFAALATGCLAQTPVRPQLPDGVAPCESCHGARGEGNPAVGAPRLAAQPQAYLVRQLAGFADGSRGSAVMSPIAKALGAAKRSELGAYYAALAAPRAAAAAAAAPERGRQLATRGDNRRRIQACANCHGPEGIGEPPTFPYLAGQHAGYLAAALKAWRDGSRKTDASGQMPAIARNLDDADIAALAAYYAAAPAPTPDTFRTAGGPARVKDTGVGREPGAAPPQSQPVGSEQGAPTTGGAQGPGGGGAGQEKRGP